MGEVGSTAGPAVGVHSQKLLLCTPWWCQQEKAKENDFLHLFDTFLTVSPRFVQSSNLNMLCLVEAAEASLLQV